MYIQKRDYWLLRWLQTMCAKKADDPNTCLVEQDGMCTDCRYAYISRIW